MKSRLNVPRTLTHPGTGQKRVFSVIRDEIYASPEPYDAGDWGKYVFGAWLEEDSDDPGIFYISFPYWRNGNLPDSTAYPRNRPSSGNLLTECSSVVGSIARAGWTSQV